MTRNVFRVVIGRNEMEAIMFAAKKMQKSGYVSQNVYDGVRKMDKSASAKHIAAMKKQIEKAKAERARENA